MGEAGQRRAEQCQIVPLMQQEISITQPLTTVVISRNDCG